MHLTVTISIIVVTAIFGFLGLREIKKSRMKIRRKYNFIMSKKALNRGLIFLILMYNA